MPLWLQVITLSWTIVTFLLVITGKGGFRLGTDESDLKKLNEEVAILRKWHHKYGDEFLVPVYEDIDELKQRIRDLEKRN